MPPTSCPPADRLEQLLLGALPASESQELEQHLASCPDCVRTASNLRTMDTFVESLKGGSPLEEKPVAPVVDALVQRMQKLCLEEDSTTLITQRPVAHLEAESVAAEIPEGLGWTGKPGEERWFLHYRLVRMLGAGGMGLVFEAEDTLLQRRVALKVMKASLLRNPSQKERFVREARAMARIRDSRVVTVHQVGEETGVPFLAMELLQGEPLDARLVREKQVPVADAVRIGREVAQGLAVAHAQGLIHRDIKPANIWLESAGRRVVLLDFGLVLTGNEDTRLTVSGHVVGTPGYIAPEQAMDEGVDERSDLFSLGVLLYRMCAGRLPFSGTSVMTSLFAAVMESARPIREVNPVVPQKLEALIQRLLSKAAKDRPNSALEVDRLLAEVEQEPTQEGAAGEAPLASPSPKEARRFRRRVTTLVGVTLLGLATLAMGAIIYLPTADGKGVLRVEIEDPEIEAVVSKSGITIRGAERHDIRIEPGQQTLKIRRGDMEFETSSFVLKKGETVRLTVRYLDGKLQAVTKEGQVLGSKEAPEAITTGWKPTPEQKTYLEAVSQLTPRARLESVIRKFRDVNGNTGELTLEPKEGEPTHCRISDQQVHDLWPLAALTSLTSVDALGTSVIDFGPMSRLPLTEVWIKLILDNVASEQMLRGMKTLEMVNDRPVKEYWAERAEIRKDVDRMTRIAGGLPLEDQQTWVRGVMQKLHPKVPEKEFQAITLGVAENGLRQFRAYGLDLRIYDFSPIRGVTAEDLFVMDGNLFDASPLARTKLKVVTAARRVGIRDLTPLAGLPLTQLHLQSCPISDLRPLASLKLETLNINRTNVSDLTPLKGMPLKRLDIGYTAVTDLAPLAGMKLSHLNTLPYTPVSEIGVLAGMPLEELGVGRVSDLSVLAGMPLKKLDFHFRLYFEPDEKVLRALPLERINGKKVDEFWRDVEKQRKADAAMVAELSKVKMEEATLKKMLGAKVGRKEFHVTIENGMLVEAGFDDGDRPTDCYAPFQAFPTLRKLSVTIGPSNFSPLMKLPNLAEINCPPESVRFNRVVLQRMPKLRTINGKPAREVLSAFSVTERKK
ncbi:MAG: protein kinase [Gemmataceae bacterium]